MASSIIGCRGQEVGYGQREGGGGGGGAGGGGRSRGYGQEVGAGGPILKDTNIWI